MSVEREMSLVEWCTKLPMHHAVNRELVALNNKLAALASQNEKLKEALEVTHSQLIDGKVFTQQMHRRPYWRYSVIEAISLPNLSTPVLNKYRAEGMRMAAEICEHISDEYREREGRRYPELKTDAESVASDCESSIRAKAHELEKTNG